MPHNFLSGLSYSVLGQYEKSGEEGKKATRLSPNDPITYETLTFGMNQSNRRRPLAHEQWKHKLNHTLFAAALYEIAFLQNDVTGMTRELEWSAGRCAARDGQSRLSLFYADCALSNSR